MERTKKRKTPKITRGDTAAKRGSNSSNSTREEMKKLKAELKELEKRRKAQKKLPKSVQETIPYLAEYDNGVIELKKLNNGKRLYSIAFTVEDMNYSTLKQEEAKIIFLRFVDIYNALPADCDAFLILNNQVVDVENLKNSIRIKDRNDELNEYRHEMNNVMEKNIILGNNQVNKIIIFLISIEASNPLEAFSAFSRIEGEVVKGFKRLGTIAKRMSTEERFELLHEIYRPANIGEFPSFNLDYKKLQKDFISMKDYICPDSFHFKTNYFEYGGKFAKCLFITDFPTIMSDRFLGELTDVSFNIIVNIAVKPIRMDEGINLVKKQILGMETNKQEAQKNAMKSGFSPDMINHNLKMSLDDATELLNDIQFENQKLFEVSYVIMHSADTKEQLDMDTQTIMTTANKYLCQLRCLDYQQEQGLNQVLPFGHNTLQIKRTLKSESTAIFIPFVAKELMHKNGFFYGRNGINGNLIYFNRLNLNNANGFYLGSSGSGKSFCAKREMLNILLNTDDEVIVIDPDGEYVHFVKGMGGEHIIISQTSNHHINPMDMDKDYNTDENGNVGDPVRAKSDFILSLCEEALNNEYEAIDAVQRSFIDRCVRACYQEYVIHNYNKDYQPTFQDLQSQFDTLANLNEEHKIAKAFELYSNGSLNIFAHQTNVDIKKRFVTYDISMLGKSMSTMGQVIMLDNVWNHVLENRKKGIRTWLYSDEFTVLLRKSSSRTFFLDTFKRIRKMGGACTGITQNITSLYRDDDAMEMLSNAEFIYLLNQAATDRVQLAHILAMSDTELEFVSDVAKGHGIIKAGRHVVPFKDEFPKDTKLYKMMTSDPEERKEIDNLDKHQGQGVHGEQMS